MLTFISPEYTGSPGPGVRGRRRGDAACPISRPENAAERTQTHERDAVRQPGRVLVRQSGKLLL